MVTRRRLPHRLERKSATHTFRIENGGGLVFFFFLTVSVCTVFIFINGLRERSSEIDSTRQTAVWSENSSSSMQGAAVRTVSFGGTLTRLRRRRASVGVRARIAAATAIAAAAGQLRSANRARASVCTRSDVRTTCLCVAVRVRVYASQTAPSPVGGGSGGTTVRLVSAV